MIVAQSTMKDLLLAKKEFSKRFLKSARPQGFSAFGLAASPDPEQNVVGVGIGEMLDHGHPTGVLAVKFFVRKKYLKTELTKKNMLPTSIDGLPVDVEETGIFRALAAKPRKAAAKKTAKASAALTIPDPKQRYRPAQPGCSIGFHDPTFRMAGTFGALVKNASGTYILSNNHVIANEGRLPLNSPIFQPGTLDDGNVPADKVASLTRFVPMVPGADNKVDAAIAKAANASVLSRDILHIGAPAGTAEASIDMRVHKFGRTTSYTVGRITSIATDVTVSYGTGNLSFEDQIVIVGDSGSFSASGDSGSLILERQTNMAVGLLFAGSSSHTLANHIGDVLQALGVTLA